METTTPIKTITIERPETIKKRQKRKINKIKGPVAGCL